jgi:peptidyl-dipeptidase Dcp
MRLYKTKRPTFKNTIEALDFSGYTLDHFQHFLQFEFETNDEIQKIAQEVSPLLSDFGNDIRLNVIYL